MAHRERALGVLRLRILNEIYLRGLPRICILEPILPPVVLPLRPCIILLHNHCLY